MCFVYSIWCCSACFQKNYTTETNSAIFLKISILLLLTVLWGFILANLNMYSCFGREALFRHRMINKLQLAAMCGYHGNVHRTQFCAGELLKYLHGWLATGWRDSPCMCAHHYVGITCTVDAFPILTKIIRVETLSICINLRILYYVEWCALLCWKND